ncbi:MAG TPA: hypothetical protein VF519_15510 [Mycobacteriales bacterium]
MNGYLAAFLLTLAVEPPVWAYGLRRALGVPARRGYRDGLLANATSHPLTWLVLFPLLPEGYAAFVAVEAFAVAWEAALLRVRVGRDAPAIAALSLVANAVSLALGVLLPR